MPGARASKRTGLSVKELGLAVSLALVATVLGGALAFGLLGIFLGPVLLGVGYTLMNEWARSSAPVTLDESGIG